MKALGKKPPPEGCLESRHREHINDFYRYGCGCREKHFRQALLEAAELLNGHARGTTMEDAYFYRKLIYSLRISAGETDG